MLKREDEVADTWVEELKQAHRIYQSVKGRIPLNEHGQVTVPEEIFTICWFLNRLAHVVEPDDSGEDWRNDAD